MAFAAMFIALLVIVIGAMGICTLLGIVLIIVSAVRRRRAVREGSKPKKAGLITGIILAVLPALAAGVLMFWMFNGVQDSPYLKAAGYRDKLNEGLMCGSTEMILSAFSESARSADPALKDEIDGMLELLGGEITDSVPSTPVDWRDELDEKGRSVTRHFTGELENAAAASGETYVIYYSGYCQYEGHPEKLGLTEIKVRSGDATVYSFGDPPE